MLKCPTAPLFPELYEVPNSGVWGTYMWRGVDGVITHHSCGMSEQQEVPETFIH